MGRPLYFTPVAVVSIFLLSAFFMAALRSRCEHYIFLLWFLVAALWNKAGHYIFVLWFLLLPYMPFSSFFLAYSQPRQIGCLPYFHTWCGLGANLQCRSETRLAENTGRTNRQTLLSGHRRTNLSVYIFATKACTDSGKNLLNSNISSTCPHNMVNFGSQTAKTCWRDGVRGTPLNFNRFRVLALLLHRCRSTEVSKTLQDVWQIRSLYFRPVISSFFLFFSFYILSSPNLSGRRSDAYHTSTHDVALVRI